MSTSPWEPDGTQPPPPLTVWDDPVSGLVTGATYEQESLRIDLAKPVEPDMDEVRRAVDAALSGEDEFRLSPMIPGPRMEVPTPTLAETPGMVAPNPRPGWPRPPVRQLGPFKPRRPAPPVRARRVRTRGGSGSAAIGIVGALILFAVVTTIVIAIISSLADTLSSIFN